MPFATAEDINTILVHYRQPYGKRVLPEYTAAATSNNPLCGDQISIQILTQNNHIIQGGFGGDICSVATASASVLMAQLPNLSCEEWRNMQDKDFLDRLDFNVQESRLNCVLLPFLTLHKALQQAKK